MKLKYIVAFLFAAIFGYSSFWLYLSLNAGVFLDQATEDLGNQGIKFEYTDYSVLGFPYRLEVTFEDISIHFENGPLSISLNAVEMEGVIHPWNFNHVILFPENAEMIFKMGSNEQIIFRPGQTSASLNSLGNESYRLSIVMEQVEIQSSFDLPFPSYFETFSTHIRKEFGIGEEVSSLLKPRLLEIVFDGNFPDASRFAIASSFRGEKVPKLTRADLIDWRDRGGTFEIDDFNYQAGEISISGSGSFTLDKDLKPLGSLGFEGTINMALLNFFEETQMLETKEASFLRNFLATDRANKPLSLSIQDGFLKLGPARMMIEVGPIIQE